MNLREARIAGIQMVSRVVMRKGDAERRPL